MVAPAAVPFTKLMSLVIKTLAKPMAKQVKHQAVKNPYSRQALIWMGQTAHGVTTRMTIWSSGYKVRSIAVLEEEKALSRGADFLSESFIFFASVGAMAYEYSSSKEKEKKKEAARLQEIVADSWRLQTKLDSLDKRLVALEEYAKANRRSILGIGAAGEYKEPEDVVPINDFKAAAIALIKENDGKKTIDGNGASLANGPESTTQQSQQTQRPRRWWWPF